MSLVRDWGQLPQQLESLKVKGEEEGDDEPFRGKRSSEDGLAVGRRPQS